MKRILLMLTFCFAIECLSTEQALAQRIPPTTRTIEAFRRIKPQMSMKQVIDICGAPDEDIGSGIHIYVYELSDRSLVRIGTPDKKRLIYVAHVLPNGEARSIIKIPNRKHKSKRRLPSARGPQIIGRERNQQTYHRQLIRNVVVSRRVNSTVGRPTGGNIE